MNMHRRLAVLLALVVLLGGAALFWSQSELHIYVVRTGSMSPSILPGDAVLDVSAPPHVRRGEVITFRLPSGGLVTHRVHAIHGDLVSTKGDANRTADPWTVAPDQVVGTVRHTLPRIGYVLVYLQQPAGIGSLMTAMLALFLAWQLFFGDGDGEGIGPTELPEQRDSDSSPGLRATALAGAAALAVAVGLVGTAATGPSSTGASFSDSRSGTLTTCAAC
jgi:signal peptidase I